MRTKVVRSVAFSVATKQDADLAWAVYPYANIGLDVRSGMVDDPKWRQKLKANVDATHPYSRTIWPAKSSSIGKWNVDWTWKWRELFIPKKVRSSRTTGSPCLSGLASQTFVRGIAQDEAMATAKSKAVLAFLAKVREQQTSFEAIPFFGELKETLQMIRHPLRGIIRQNRNSARQFTRLQRLYRLKPARLEEMMEKAYLQWTYGVAPLVNDIQSVVESVKRLLEEPAVVRLRVTLPVPESRVWSQKGTQFYEGSSQTIGFQYEINASGSYRIVGALKHKSQPESWDRFKSLNGLRARDIVPAIWELTGYSFLIDYFVNVGDVLGGVFTDTSELVYVCGTAFQKQIGTGYAIGLPSVADPVSWPLSIVSGNLDKVSINREIPSLHVGIRDFHWQDTTVGQWFNTAVLSSQRLRDAAYAVKRR